ncbi:hypothetical protein B0H16DRAFT_1418063 [Mycena metata]|uniref:HAT C-terminal dimerisation domain-containing protein n=1 Tax=Mycena metata TaxID=1033252 RepID=A0AAD7NCC4_9AGAR|nr:hypothetical protein B0H16DRAFT_1418063 [Mycena metata]
MWESYKQDESVKDLAKFAIMLLGLVVNQAATERTFSDLKIKKTRLRNRLGTEKLEKMSKIGADIRQENMAAGLIHERAAREVHDPTKVAGLLSVPRYADALEPNDDEEKNSNLVNSTAKWRVELTKWVKDAQELDDEQDPAEDPIVATDDEEDTAEANPKKAPRKAKSFFPRSLALLFGGKVANPVGKPRAEQFTREALMMELLATEESDEELDDGALSGSGDEYGL